MEKNANYTLVGLFVVIVLLSCTGFVVWLAGTYDARAYMRYTVLFDNAVSGLEEGGVVKYRGVTVGRVIDIRLVDNRPDIVKVDIEVDETTPVRASTIAALKPQGITGLSFVELKTEASDSAEIQKQKGEKYPSIKAAPSQLDQLFQDAPELSEGLIRLSKNLNLAVSKINGILNDKNIASIASILENMDSTSADMQALTQTLSQSLNTYLNPENARSLAKMIKNLEETSSKVNTLITTISENQGSLDRFSSEGLDNLSALIQDSRTMTDAVIELTQTIKEDPSQFIFQPTYDGVKIKQ